MDRIDKSGWLQMRFTWPENEGGGVSSRLLEEEMSEYRKLWKKARRKGWVVPVNNAFPQPAWVHYWRACEEHERNPEKGRPVPPHRSA